MKTALRVVGYWVVPSMMGILFILIGVGKFTAPGWRNNFERWGYPDGAYAIVGVLEILGGLLLLVRPLTRWSALGLSLILMGAIGTHLYWSEANRLFNPVLYLVLLGLSAYARWPPASHSARKAPNALD